MARNKLTIRNKIEIIVRALDRPVTARELTNIIYGPNKQQASIFQELDFMARLGLMKKEGSKAQYYYSVVEEQPKPQYFYVFQNRTFTEEYEDGFLWAPKLNKANGHNHYWDRMQEVKKGDVILHGGNSKFIGISIAKADCYSSPRPNNMSDEWAKDGWRVDADYFLFPNPIKPVDYFNVLKKFYPEKYGPFDKDGGGNQGYLFEANQDLARCLIDITSGKIIAEGTAPDTHEVSVDESVELLDEKPQVLIKSYLQTFRNKLPEFQKKEKELETLRAKFVSDYTMKKIIDMTKEEYVVGLGNKKSFCYRIETELQELGNILGSTSYKFGLYYGTSGEDQEKKYRFLPKWGSDPDAVLESVKEQIVKLRMAGEAKDYDAIRNSIIAPMYRGKLLSTFFPNDFLGVFVDEHLDHFMTMLGIEFSESDDILEKQRKLVEWKNEQVELKEQTNYIFQCFLYESFGRPFDDAKEEKDHQKAMDDDYPKDYVSNVKISIEQWKQMLQDPEIFHKTDIELIKRFYLSDNHASTCYDLAAQDGVSPQAYITPVVMLAKRISDAAGIEPTYRENGVPAWWRIPFWGRRREDGHFEWKVRPQLAKALSALYPGLDIEEFNDEEDKNLVEDLKQASLSKADEDFKYKGQAKKKSAAVYTNGHKTYPRDRQTAINALAHAHYECEIGTDHPSFIRKNSNKKYTEPHHLIPMAFSDEFSVSLDVEENIVSLCSNCHNQIHYGRDAVDLLKQLYEERKDVLDSVGIKVTLERLLQMYHISSDEE